MAKTQEPRRGPQDVPARGWFAAGKRTGARIKQLNLPLLASGVAFWVMLSIFPALIALITIYGLVSDPATVTEQVSKALGAVSSDAKSAITGQLTAVTSHKSQALGVGLVASLVALLWTASSGMQNFMKALTTSYEQVETRKFVRLRGTALLLTIGGLVFSAIVLAAVAVVPPLLSHWIGNGPLKYVLLVAELIVVFALMVSGITVLYRYGPANRPVGLRWASAGAVLAATLWVIGTIAFAVYVNLFSHYGNTYGALAGVVIFMLWLYLSSFVVLFGALVNAEAERGEKGNAPSQPEGIDRDVIRLPEDREQRLRPSTVDQESSYRTR
jgi:membrane protein